MNKNIIIILTCLLFGFFLSCGELFLGTDPENNPNENFQILWEDFDKHYSRFELKKVNWDSLYNVYKPKINSSTTGEELFEITTSLLSHLRDSHARIESPHGIYSYRKKDYHHYFNLEIIYNNYLINPRYFRYFTYGMLNENLGYIHIRTFNENEDSYKFIDNIIIELGNPDGVIIDVRDNGGEIHQIQK
jgi:Tricorn protease C1 domain/Peptidase family S41